MNVDQRQVIKLQHLDFKDITTTIRNMDIELKNTVSKKNPTGHLKGKHMHLRKVTLTIGIIIHGIILIILESMDTF